MLWNNSRMGHGGIVVHAGWGHGGIGNNSRMGAWSMGGMEE